MPPNRIAPTEYSGAERRHEIAAIMVPVISMKKAPSEIMLNKPDRKIRMTASAVNISGASASIIFPIRRKDVNGPIKKLRIAASGSLLARKNDQENERQRNTDNHADSRQVDQEVYPFLIHGSPSEFPFPTVFARRACIGPIRPPLPSTHRESKP